MQWVGLLVCFAVILQSIESLFIPYEAMTLNLSARVRVIYRSILITRLVLAGVALFFPTTVLAVMILVTSYTISVWWRGTLNGGSDGMTFHTLLAWSISLFNPEWASFAALYVVSLTTVSYFTPGFAKLRAGGWLSGETLRDILELSNATRSGIQRRLLLAKKWRLKFAAWTTLAFELTFPIVLFRPELRPFYLVVAALFHISNVGLFGLNRFFWIWIATYPAFFA